MEKKILELFLRSNKLKFNEIEKKLNTRSNKVAYHLKTLVKKGILEKNKEFYKLTETSEALIPYLSSKKSPLPIILIHIGNKNEAFLIKREKRPFKDLLGLPGGRLMTNESIPKAVSRIMKDKYSINAKFQSLSSISLEYVRKNSKVIHTFLLILIKATTKDKIQLTQVEKARSSIIKSDYELIKSNKNQTRKDKINIKTIYSKD